MERRKASDFHPEVLTLFDGYVHGRLSRREFLDRAAKFAVGAFTAAAMLDALKPNYAWSQQVPKDDPRIRIETATYSVPNAGKLSGYLAKPAKGPAKLPAIVVVHENRGVSPHIEDVARRLAVLGYLAFAPDALSQVGGYPGDDEKAAAMFAKLERPKMTEDLGAAAPYLLSRSDTAKVGAVGFCFGGGVVNVMPVRYPDLAAAVPYYPSAHPPLAEVPKIKAALLLHYASEDPNVNKNIPAFEEALKANKVRYEMHIYQNTRHAFHNETTPRYDEAAAKLSWQRTVDFLNKHVKGA